MHAGEYTFERASWKVWVFKKVLYLDENLLILEILETFEKLLENLDKIWIKF